MLQRWKWRMGSLCFVMLWWSTVAWGQGSARQPAAAGASAKSAKNYKNSKDSNKTKQASGKQAVAPSKQVSGKKAAQADPKQEEDSEAAERARRRAARRARRARRLQRRQRDRSEEPLVRGGIYDRPYIYRQGNTLAIGGYVEMLGQYLVEEGIPEGFSFEARRFNLFVFSSISRLIRLTAEIEYEHGAEEIALEMALLDVRFHSMINLRGGIILVPLGRFNVAHDAPIYDVIDRPLVSTQIIPATYSDIGFGLFGAFYPGTTHKITYEAYVINGLTSGILSNSAEGTRIAQGKAQGLFAQDENGSPAMAFRLGYESPIGLDFAVSMYAGIYNQFHKDGEQIADPRWLTILAFNAEFSQGPVTIRVEMAWAHIDLPENLPEIFASDQWGIYADAVIRLWQGRMLFLRNAAVYLVGRFDYIDLNMGTRQATGETIGDETIRITAGVSFRPTPQTSIRVVYQHNWINDVLNNPARRAGIQFGIASYF